MWRNFLQLESLLVENINRFCDKMLITETMHAWTAGCRRVCQEFFWFLISTFLSINIKIRSSALRSIHCQDTEFVSATNSGRQAGAGMILHKLWANLDSKHLRLRIRNLKSINIETEWCDRTASPFSNALTWRRDSRIQCGLKNALSQGE